MICRLLSEWLKTQYAWLIHDLFKGLCLQLKLMDRRTPLA